MKKVLGISLICIFLIACGLMMMSGFEIGDTSVCPNGYGIYTYNGTWRCISFNQILSYTNITFINSTVIQNVVTINTTSISIYNNDSSLTMFLNENNTLTWRME